MKDNFQKNHGKAAKCGYCGSTKGKNDDAVSKQAPRPNRSDILNYLKKNAPIVP